MAWLIQWYSIYEERKTMEMQIHRCYYEIPVFNNHVKYIISIM
jgi:hypothetical protein